MKKVLCMVAVVSALISAVSVPTPVSAGEMYLASVQSTPASSLTLSSTSESIYEMAESYLDIICEDYGVSGKRNDNGYAQLMLPDTVYASPKLAKVVQDATPFRIGAGANYPIINICDKDDSVIVLGEGATGWAYIDVDGTRGFIQKSRLEEESTYLSSTQRINHVVLDLESEAAGEITTGIEAYSPQEAIKAVESALVGKHLNEILYCPINTIIKTVNTSDGTPAAIRKATDVKSEKLGEIPNGGTVEVVGYGFNMGWAYVSYNGVNGFVRNDLFETAAEAAEKAAAKEREAAEAAAKAAAETSAAATAEATASESIPSGEQGSYLGNFRLTFYCDCVLCCGQWSGLNSTASGTVPTEGRTIAVDPDVIPLGTHVIINGHEYVAEDTGGGINGNSIDVYLESHELCLQKGIQYADVYLAQ